MSAEQDDKTMKFLTKVFEGNLAHVEDFADELENHQDGQDPVTTTVTCCDSRVIERSLTGHNELGEGFTHEVIGNHVATYDENGEKVITGSIEYIPEHTDTYTSVVVIGHTGCGAVTASYNTLEAIEQEKDLSELNLDELSLNEYNGENKGINSELRLMMETGLIEDYQEIKGTEETREEEINKLVEKNVDNQVDMLLENTDYNVIGMVYDMTGTYGGEKGQLYLTNFEGTYEPEELDNLVEDYEGVKTGRLN